MRTFPMPDIEPPYPIHVGQALILPAPVCRA